MNVNSLCRWNLKLKLARVWNFHNRVMFLQVSLSVCNNAFECVCVCVWMCLFVSMCVIMFIYEFTYAFIYVFVFVCIRLFLSLLICMSVFVIFSVSDCVITCVWLLCVCVYVEKEKKISLSSLSVPSYSSKTHPFDMNNILTQFTNPFLVGT